MRTDVDYELVTQVRKTLRRTQTGEYLFSIDGKLLCSEPGVALTDDFYGEEAWEHKNPGTVVGYLHGYLIHARRALEDGYNIVEECDNDNQAVSELATAFYSPENGTFQPHIEKNLAPNRLDLLSIETMMLHPDYRGQGLGHWMVRRMVEWHGGGCGVLALNVTPPQAYPGPEESLFESHPEKDPGVAAMKLIQYFDSIGFTEIENTSYMALSLDQGIMSLEPDEEDGEEEAEEILWN